MAEKTIDDFVNMPLTSQCLYFHLTMTADGKGYVNNAYATIRGISAKEYDLAVLLDHGYVDYESERLHITHWDVHRG